MITIDFWGTVYETRNNFYYHIIDVRDEPAMALLGGVFFKQTDLTSLRFPQNMNINIEVVVSSFEENILMRIESNAFHGKTEFC